MAVDLEPITVEGTPPPAASAPARVPSLPSSPPLQALSPEPGKVAIHDDDGTVSLIAAKDLPAAMDEGARPATRVELSRAQAGAGGKAAASAAGALRGVSFGFSDKALIEGDRLAEGDAGAEEMRRALNLAREIHPGYSAGSEVVGALAPLLFGLPPVSEAAEGATALGRVGAAAPRLLGEGAVMGAGQQISEDALGDHDTTAEKVALSAAGGAALNLLLGGTLHAGAGFVADRFASRAATAGEREIERGLARYSAKDIDAIAAREFGEAAPGVGERVRKHLAKISAGVAGKDAATVDRFTSLSPEGRELRRLAVFDGDSEIEAAQKAIRTAGDDFLRATPDVTDEFRGALKADKIAKAVKTGNEEAVAPFARAKIARTIDTVERELSSADGVAPQMVKSLEQISRSAYHADAQIAEAIERGEGVNERAFMALDMLKRDVQKLTDGGYRRLAAMTDPFETRLARRTVDSMNEAQDDLRRSLEDVDMFGKAADVQASINAEWSKQIEASKRFSRALTTDVGRRADNPFLRQRGIDPSKLDTYTRNLLNPNADLTHQAVKDYVDSTERLARTLRENVDLPASKLEQVKRIEGAAKTFRGELERTSKTLTAINQYKRLTANEADSVAGLATSLGFAAGGPLGGAVGTAIGALVHPGRTVAQLAAIERMASKADAKLDGAAKAFFSGSRRAAKAPARSVSSDDVAKLRAVVTNPSAVQERAAAVARPIEHSAPKVAQALTTTIARAAAYLARSLPPEPTPMGPFESRHRKLSASQLAKAKQAIEAVNDLDGLLHDLSRGRMRRESVEAIRDVYPKVYAELQDRVREQAMKHGDEMTIQQQVALSVLFDEPLNAQMRPSTIRGFQSAFAAREDEKDDGGREWAPKRGGNIEDMGASRSTSLERMEAGDA